MEIQAMVTTNEKDFEKQTLLLDDPKADEVLVKIVASGVLMSQPFKKETTLY